MNHTNQRTNEKILFSIFALFGKPKTLLDIGSGDGTMVQTARLMGIDALGIDLQAYNPDLRADLTKPIDLGMQYEMVLCLEVAEHINPNGESIFLDNIARHTFVNGRLIWSSALPGQSGEGHVNMKSPIYWRNELWKSGKFSFRPALTSQLALILSQTAEAAAHWLPANLQVF